MIVIVACGMSKRNTPCQAQNMYTGSYFRSCLRYAKATAPDGRIYILSAKYGLLKLNDIIAPYNLKLGFPGAIKPSAVSKQAEQLNIAHETVTVLGGQLYVNLCMEVWQAVVRPLPKVSLCMQRQWIKRQLNVQPIKTVHL